MLQFFSVPLVIIGIHLPICIDYWLILNLSLQNYFEANMIAELLWNTLLHINCIVLTSELFLHLNLLESRKRL